MSGGHYLVAAYAVVLVAVLAYVAIIAAKVARLERDVASLRETGDGARSRLPGQQERAEER